MKIVPYYRVSTQKQGESGLGLEAQQAAVEQHAKLFGAEILSPYTEIESGKNCSRPQLKAALAHAKGARAVLAVAKLDRLARNASFLLALIDSDADFVCCDNPHANRITLQIMAIVADNEARDISHRTKVALQAAKARGVRLGSSRPGHWDGREEARLNGSKIGVKAASVKRSNDAKKALEEILPVVTHRKSLGMTNKEVADSLNADDRRTRTGLLYNELTIKRILRKAKE